MTTRLIGLPEEPLGLLFIMQGLFCSHYPNVCSLHAAITVPGKTVVHGNWSMRRMKWCRYAKPPPVRGSPLHLMGACSYWSILARLGAWVQNVSGEELKLRNGCLLDEKFLNSSFTCLPIYSHSITNQTSTSVNKQCQKHITVDIVLVMLCWQRWGSPLGCN